MVCMYVTNIKELIRCAVTVPYMQYTGFLIYQYYKCTEMLNFATYWCIAGIKGGGGGGGGGGAIPAACLHHALYKVLPAWG